MTYRISALLTVLFCLFFAAGCKKTSFAGEEAPAANRDVNPALVYKTPSTAEEKELVQNLAKVTEVLKELYKDVSNLKVVNASIYAKVYTDQSILLKDLIYPASSRLATSKEFARLTGLWNVSLQAFAANFWKQAEKMNDDSFMSYLSNLNATSRQYYYEGETSIYTPYQYELQPADEGGYYAPVTSIITATADANEGWGEQPYYINGVFQYYVPVLINDDYAYDNPTQIIGVNGIEPYDVTTIVNSAFPPEAPIDIPNVPREIKQVYVGDVRCRNQYDALISFTGNGGGSEIRFTRADGFLKIADGQVQADMYVTGDKTISRKDIRKENWVDFSYEWDADWEVANLQQNLAIYEEDNRNTSTLSSTLNTTLTWPAANGQPGVAAGGNIGFSISYKSDDAIIKQTNYNRDVFFILNRTNLEGEMHNGWPVRDKNANVSFTLNDRTYY